MATNLYQSALQKIIDRAMTGTINLLSDDIRVMMVGAGYTPNKDHDFVSDVVANEISGTGYIGGYGGSGRKALTTRATGINDTTDKAFFDADDLTWTGLSGPTPAWAIVHKKATTDSDSPIIACVDVVDLTTVGEDYQIQWSSNGIIDWAA